MTPLNHPLFSPFPDTPSVATGRLHNLYGRVIANSLDGVLRNTVTTFANRTDRVFDDVALDPRGAFATYRVKRDYLGDRRGGEYQGDLFLGAFGLLTFGARVEQETALSGSRELAPVPTSRRLDFDAEQTTRSLFALHQITLGDRMYLSLGGRIDEVVDVDRFDTWRATAAYEIPETGTKLRTSIGTGGKAPSLYQLYSPFAGTPDLESERSIGIDGGIDQTVLDGQLKFSITAFANRYTNLIDFTSGNNAEGQPICPPTRLFGCYFNVAEASTSGVEASGEVKLIPEFLRLRMTYTHLVAKDLTTNLRLARRPEDQGRIGLALTPWAGLLIEPSLVIVSERFSSNGELDPLPPYARLDMYAEYKINDTFSIYGRAENLTDTRYEEVKNYGTAGRSFFAGLRATW